MDIGSVDTESGKQMAVLKFMEITECETYEEAKFFVSMHNFNVKDAVNEYLMNKGQSIHQKKITNNSSTTHQHKNPPPQYTAQTNEAQFSFTPEEASILQKRLKSRVFLSPESQHIGYAMKNPQKNTICNSIYKSCKNSFKCFVKIKQQLKKKLNSLKKNNDRIFYFQQIYNLQLQQAGFQQQNGLIQGFELSQIEQNQKIKILKNQPFKPVFVLICPNRKIPLIQNFLKNTQLLAFIKQNFEVLFITLSELRELRLDRNHTIRRIKKCPIVLGYVRNIYDLQDVLFTFQGEKIKDIKIQSMKQGLRNVSVLVKKWNYMINLQKKLRQNSITSLVQVLRSQDYGNHFDHSKEYDNTNENETPNSTQSTPTPQYQFQHPQTKRSLIQQQTKIYQQLVAQQTRRKQSLELQKQKLQQIKQLREIRKISLPEEPSHQQKQNCIEFRFRCPLNGEYISRRFLNDQKVDILYQFVDVCQKIQFQTQPQRSFDLFTSFPPTSLAEKKQFLLKDVFDQQKQNILIRQM